MSIKHLLLVGVLFASCGILKRGTIPWEERANKAEIESSDVEPTLSEVKPEVALTTSTSTPASRALSKNEKKLRSILDEAFKD